LHEYKCWRNLGNVWNNIYKHYSKLNEYGFLENSYNLLLQKYLKRTKNKTLKFTSCDTTILINKNGIDCKGRNKYAKNKFCTKLFTIIDKNKIPIVIFYISGNTNDIKCLNISLEKFLEQYNKNINYFLADTGFHSKFISGLLQKYKVKYLIPKNMRNSKKYKNRQ
jgi:transposase